jgi:hypothetical protein
MASITIISPHFFENALNEGMEFEVREGAKIIGVGKLTKILNPSLKKLQRYKIDKINNCSYLAIM